jgi:uncharacterized membrane protein YidH (DUF202 family)
VGQEEVQNEQLLLSELQVLFAEKRTYFAILRTGLAVITVPLTFIVFLTATAQYHGIFSAFWLGALVVGTLCLMSIAGIYISYDASTKIRTLNSLIKAAEHSNKRIDDIIV